MGIWEAFFASIPGVALAGWTLYITKKYDDEKERRQLEQLKLQIISENKKNSYIKVNEEMNRALKVIRLNLRYGEPSVPTEPEVYYATYDALIKEFPFVEKSVAQGLRLFLTIMAETVSSDDDPRTDREEDIIIKRAYDELEYISEHIIDFLRSHIYLENEVPSLLSKIALLKICRFINKSEFEGLKPPNQNIIELNGVQSPIDIVQAAENNLALFKDELGQFLDFLKTNPLHRRNPENLRPAIAAAKKLLRDL
jgi:hypothetical protein